MFKGKRFDLFAKRIYAEMRMLYKKYGIATNANSWYRNLYTDSILTFNGGWEHNSPKNDIGDFIVAYDSLMDEIAKNGYTSLTPVEFDGDHEIVNNAHRAVVCETFNIPYLATYTFDTNSGGYDYDFFASRLKHGVDYYPEHVRSRVKAGMEQNNLDQSAIEMLRLNPEFRIVCVMPRTDTALDGSIENILNSNGKIVYKKTFQPTREFFTHFIEEVYFNEKWVGYTRANKARDSWGEFPIRFYIHRGPIKDGKVSPVNYVSLKSTIRSLTQNNSTVHINDYHYEALRYAPCILHKNTIEYLKKYNPCHVFNPENDKLFTTYTLKHQHDTKDRCIDSSFTLAAYNLRPARDLDYIGLSINCPGENLHNNQYTSIGDILEIVYNPSKHFYIHGQKVATLSETYKLKIRRGEKKDRRDCELMSTLIQNIQKS